MVLTWENYEILDEDIVFCPIIFMPCNYQWLGLEVGRNISKENLGVVLSAQLF